MDACLATPTLSSVTPTVPATERDLVRAAAHGDRRAFEALYRTHVGRVHGTLLRLSGHDHARAEDWAQESFVRAWRKLAEFRHESAFGTWLHRLAVNTALMALRAERADPVDYIDPDALPEPSGETFCAAEREQLERAIARLPTGARTVLVLHDVEGWSHPDIGSELGIATGTSKAQLHRARRLLHRMLTEGVGT